MVNHWPGYRIDLERPEVLREGSAPYKMLAKGEPKPIDPRPWMQGGWFHIRNQGNQGSCRGHSLAAAARYCTVAAAGGLIDLDEDGKKNEYLQDDFSAQWCYIQCQKSDNIRGDNGATIAGGIKVGMELGLCREVVWPYPNPVRYQTTIPSGAADDAKRFKFGRYTYLDRETKDPDEMEAMSFDWIQAGQGAIDIGTVWPLPFTGGCVVTSMSRSARGGGHATCGIGHILGETLLRELPALKGKIKDDEWLYVWANSHSVRAQHQGFYYYTRKGLRDCYVHSWTSAVLWSDMQTPIKRKIDWSKNRLA
jgi:hypothetical protein